MKHIINMPAEWKNTSELFLALGDEHRQRILLAFEAGERLNISQLVAASTLSRTAVSHHIKTLHRAGALESEKVGKEVYFWINRAAIQDALVRVLNYIEQQT
jgi:ArsR family transcriptional regulator, lead/cadmium/zinc/bismuth-responsive transcriptional repressor